MTDITNYNPAYNTNYRLEFVDSPHLNFFIQNVSLPGVDAIGVETPYRGSQTFFQADRLDFDPLNVTFLIDENFENYLFLFNWMKRTVEQERPPNFMRDATLHIFTGNKTANLIVNYYGMFPQTLGSVDFDSSTTDTSPIMCTTTLRYQYYTISRINPA